MLRRLTQPTRRIVVIVLLCAGLLPLASLSADQTPSLQEQIAQIVRGYEEKSGAIVGVSVVRVPRNNPLVSINEDRLLIPASNQKLLTSAVALERLGSEFTFTTKVYLDGSDVVVVGDYDPTLGDPVLARVKGETIYTEVDRWARKIKDALRGKDIGDVLVCVRASRSKYRHPDWKTSQHQRWYSAPLAAVNFNDNCVDVRFEVEGQTPVVVISPATRFIRIVNKVKLSRKHRWRVRTNEDDSVLTFSGSVKTTTPDALSVAIDDPPLLLGRVLGARLERSGVRVIGNIRRADQDTVDLSQALLVGRTITPLSAVMKRANKRSLNMTAECLLLRAGDGTWDGSAKIASQTLADEYHLDPRSFVFRDGGGLSHKNLVTAAGLTKLLSEVLSRKDCSVFLESLPISGTDGTMRKRLTATPYLGRILGKTGHLAGVSSLSGYVLDGRTRPALAFAILINRADHNAKPLQDRICQLLVDRINTR